MSTLNLRAVFKIIGQLLCMEAFFMLFPLGISLLYRENDWSAFALTIVITAVCGYLMSRLCYSEEKHIGKREGFLIVSTSWIFFSLFGMLPFLFSGYMDNIAGAFFETMSGFTTTGSSVIPNVEIYPHGLLFWRSLIQWLGGMGIILFTLAILPSLNSGGGIQMFNAEVTGIKHSKLRPRIRETAKRLWGIYSIITLVLIVLLYLGPMNLFDAVCQAFATVSTGGYSTKSASIAHWDSPYVEYIISLFMFISSINFSLIYLAALGNIKELFRDEEVRWYIGVISIAVIGVFTALLLNGNETRIEPAFRVSLFQVMSLISTTGFATADYNYWSNFACIILFLIMIFGACAGSTSGGAKIVRFIVLMKNTQNECYRHIHPRAIKPIKINQTVIPNDLVTKTLGFLAIYFLIIVGSSLTLIALGYNIDEAFVASISAISDVGPATGSLGPVSNFSAMPDLGKWVLSMVMLAGRLELFTILVLFTPYFWKR